MKTIIVKINASKCVKIDKSSINTLELRKSLVSQISAGKREGFQHASLSEATIGQANFK
jgi:hypothetical protein